MDIDEKVINSFDELIADLTQYYCGHHIYRGVSNSLYDLKPSVGRISEDILEKHEMPLNKYEEQTLRMFKLKSFSEYKSNNFNDLDWMVLAQHYGLPTRLLDWTISPLVALYFATKPVISKLDYKILDYENDSAIYRYHCKSHLNMSKLKNPTKIKEHGIFFHKNITNRLSGQFGLFSIHPNPKEPFNENLTTKDCDGIDKIIIPKSLIREVFEKIYALGIRHESVFPDLDGYSHDITTTLNLVQCHTELKR